MITQAGRLYARHALPLILIGLMAAILPVLPMFAVGLAMGGWVLLQAGNLYSPMMAEPPFLLLLWMIPAVLASIFIAPFSLAGQMAAIRDSVAEDRVGVGRFFAGGAAHYGRMLRYMLLALLTLIGLHLLLVIIFFVPLRSHPVLALAVIVPLALLLMLAMGPAFMTFAPYAVVADGLGARQAYGLAWKALSRRFGAVLRTGLAMVGLSLLASVINVALSTLGVAGTIAGFVVMAAFHPFLSLYIVVRYLQTVRPHLDDRAEPPGAGA